MTSEEVQLKNNFGKWLGEFKDELEEKDILEAEAKFDEGVELVAKAKAHDKIDSDNVGQFIRTCNDKLSMTKTNIKEKVNNAIEDARSELIDEDPTRVRVDDLAKQVSRVVKLASTDSVFSPEYVWEWDDINGNSFRVKTENEHKHWTDFQNKLMDGSHDLRLLDPSEEHRDMSDWKEFIQDVVQENKIVKEEDGPRTEVIEAMENMFETRVCKPSVKEAIQSGASLAYDEDEDELWMASSTVGTLADEHNISRVAVRDELEAKNILEGKVSYKFDFEDVKGQERFWRLPGDFAEPTLEGEEDAQENSSHTGTDRL